MIDNVIESISFGLEQNDFKFNQRRIAEVKYLGELYNYRMLEHPVVFDTMYKIMTFGHGRLNRVYVSPKSPPANRHLGGAPVPGRINPFDLPDDFFRIRLVATVLETCGMFFNRGAAGKKLDYFLSFLQVNQYEEVLIAATTNTVLVLYPHKAATPHGYRVHCSGHLLPYPAAVEACN